MARSSSPADELATRIDASPTPYHAVQTAVAVLEAAGWVADGADDDTPDGAPGAYVVTGGAVIAWRRGARPPRAFRIIGAHTDSPNLRLKPNPDHTAAGWSQLNVEVYGGALINSWLDRELGLAGRLVTGDGGVHLFRLDDLALRIPQLAIHLDREVNDKGLRLDPQQHLRPVWNHAPHDGADIRARMATAAGVEATDVVAWDVMLFDLAPSTRIGADGIWLSAPRLDNLCSSFAAIDALVEAHDHPADVWPVVCLYDHEEVGSTSTTGADSVVLASALERLVLDGGGTRGDFLRAMPASLCASADMAHATHPNYVDRHDPDHQIALNAGPVIKINANQRYASDASTIGAFAAACERAGVPSQRFVSRNDVPCGSTIGPVTSARLGVPTVDVGIAQLSMHSVRELCGADDVGHYRRALAEFLR